MQLQSLPTAADRDAIRAQLASAPPRMGQIDVNGKCNARCWYCPVKYQGNPEEFAVQMPVADVGRVLGALRNSALIPPTFRFLYSCHYNEVLLYRHFAEMIPVFRRYGFATMILSNGTPLTPEKSDLVLANPDVFWGITLNVPALERGDWAAKAGMPARMHDLLSRNLYGAAVRGGVDVRSACRRHRPRPGGYLPKLPVPGRNIGRKFV